MQAGRWKPVASPVAFATLTAVLMASCGAGNDSAPAPTRLDQCVSMDKRLAGVLDQIQTGHLQHVADILAHDLDEPSQRAVIALLLAFAQALPPGAAEKLPQALEDPRVAALLPLLVTLLAQLPGDPTTKPPRPPKTAEMTAFSLIARTCLTRELFELLRDVMRDTRSPDLLSRVLVDVVNGAPQIRQALAAGGIAGRQGFVELLHNALTSIAAPDFAPLPLVQTLDGLRNAQNPGLIDAFDGLLRVILLTPGGLPDAAHVQALSGFSACMLARDPSMTVMGLGYDVLLSEAVTTTALPEPTTETNGAMRTILPIFADMNVVLAENDAARDAWTQILGLMLRPDIAVAALPELIELLKSDVVVSVLELVSDLLTHPCPALEGP